MTGCTLGGAGGTQYWASFQVDVTNLEEFLLHFDLYNTDVRNCTGAENCETVVSRDDFAPFSHDAQSPPVPEPATMLLLGTGLAVGAVRKYRRRAV